MKDSYKVLENGKIDIIDYDREGVKTTFQMEYQDNIEDILKQQDVREYLELRKLILNNKISSNNKAIKNFEKAIKIINKGCGKSHPIKKNNSYDTGR